MARKQSTKAVAQDAQEERRQVLALRRDGLGYEEIAEKLHIEFGRVHKIISAAIAEWKKERVDLIDEVKFVSALRLEDEAQNLYRLSQAIEKETGAPVDLAVIDQARKLAETRIKVNESLRRLVGADAPQKIAPTSPDGNKTYQMTPGQRDDRITAYIASLTAKRAREEEDKEDGSNS